jgi:glucokinase
MKTFGLVADVGGTNVRFAVVDIRERAPALLSPRLLSIADHLDIVAAARAYLSEIGLKASPETLVFAVAGPVTNNEIYLTNARWRISASELAKELEVGSARLINDYEAIAEAVPFLAAHNLLAIGSAPALEVHGEGVIAIIGPGTGLGIAGLVRKDDAHATLVTEGGHVAFAPTDEIEVRILQILARKFGRVSAERLLSGPGLSNLYAAMAEIEGVAAREISPERITQLAQGGETSFEARVFARFCQILGSVAGDAALMMGARQGVLIAGGILPSVAPLLSASGFRARFEDKARFRAYMQAIPTYLITEPHIGLIGAAAVLLQETSEAEHRRPHAAR